MTQSLYAEARSLIPGGTQLYSKRPELYAPDRWPAYYSKAKGIEVTDLDGRTYLDFSTMGLGACILGYGDEDVDRSVTNCIRMGSASSLNCPEEVELAKILTSIHPWAQQVRYARSGGEAIAIAIRIARTKTGKTNIKRVANSYHGWHVNSPIKPEDYLTSGPKFGYAAILVDTRYPEDLLAMREYSDAMEALLIADEISAGFRQNLGGAHLRYGVTPDIAVFAKAMSNGYPMAAVIGTEKVMSAAQDTFISSTSWSERIGPTAAIATITKIQEKAVGQHVTYIGEQVRKVLESEARGFDIKVTGHPTMTHIDFGSPELQTLYTQLMLERGFLAGKDFYPSYSHTMAHVDAFRKAVRETLRNMAWSKDYSLTKEIDYNRVKDMLEGPVAESGIRRQ